MEPNKQLLRDPDIQVTRDVIENALGSAFNTYVKFVDELVRHDIHLEWNYYTDGKAWLAKGIYQWKGIRGGQKQSTVFWLSIWDNFFKISIYIPENKRKDVLNLALSDRVRQMVIDSKQMGKLKFFPLVFEMDSDAMLEMVFRLVDFKKNNHT